MAVHHSPLFAVWTAPDTRLTHLRLPRIFCSARQHARQRHARQRKQSARHEMQRSGLGESMGLASWLSLPAVCAQHVAAAAAAHAVPQLWESRRDTRTCSVHHALLAPHLACRAEAEAAEAARAAAEAALRRRQSEKAMALPEEPAAGGLKLVCERSSAVPCCGL